MKQLATLIAFVTAIPIFGMAVGGYIRADYQKEWLRMITKEYGDAGANREQHSGAARMGRSHLQRIAAS